MEEFKPRSAITARGCTLTGDHGPVGLFLGIGSLIRTAFAGVAMMLSGFLPKTGVSVAPVSVRSHRNVMPLLESHPPVRRSRESGNADVDFDMLAFGARQWRGCATMRISMAGQRCR
ncbi:hypothetical protein ACWIGM_24055 [Bosea sp. NPDC055332]